MIKIGDKAKILEHDSIEDYLKKFIGRSGMIVSTYNDHAKPHCGVLFPDENVQWYFENEALEVVEAYEE